MPNEKEKLLAIIVDLDGTVAIHGEERGHYDYEKVGADAPHLPIIALVNGYVQSSFRRENRIKLIFVSGREDRCHVETRAWLYRFFYPDFVLLMRRTGDRRPSSEVKEEIYATAIKRHYHVELVLDDRNDDVAMWRKQGLTCLQVACGDF